MADEQAMTATAVKELPLRRGGDRLRPRLPLNEIAGRPERLLAFRYPNGVTGYLATTVEDFREVLADPRFHAKRFLGEPQATAVSVSVPDMPGFIPSMNGPEHLRVRRLAAADFSVKRIRDMRTEIDRIVDLHLDALEKHGSPADLYEQYCLAIPSEVIAGILGIPHTQTEDFQNAARLTIGGRADALEDPEAPARAIARLHDIIGEVIALKRKQPGDDLVTKLTRADPSLPDEEIKGLCTNLLLAGHETTATGSALAVALLLERPDERAAFLARPDRVPESIEELVRFRTRLIDSGAGTPRLATADIDYHGIQIKKGDWVMPSTAVANADPALCPAADQDLDLRREEPARHVSFGFGAHTCLGQHLARAELQAIVWRLFERLPTLEPELPLNELPWMEKGFGYRMAELPVRW
jgi:cytochrome P450